MPGKQIRAAVDQLIDSLDIREPRDIDVELIAAHLGAYVFYRPLANEEGHLLRSGDVGVIVVDSRARRSRKWRFVIAHELGHFLRHRELDQFKLCTSRDLASWYRKSGYELEANLFAGELLMPERLFGPLCERNEPTLEDIRQLSSQFGTSLTATAIRFAELCPEPTAVVQSTRGIIDWAYAGRRFALPLARGHRLGQTYARDLFAGQDECGPRPIEAHGWTRDRVARAREIVEDSVRLGGFESVLSLLWHPPD